jgi:uncharacterized repeat protein (TIGR01451 family)
VKPGDVIVYSLQVTNRGTASATGVTVQDLLVLSVDFNGISNPPPTSVTNNGKLLTWILPTLAPNQTFTIVFEVVVSETIRGTYTVLPNAANVVSDQTPLAWSNTTTHVYDPKLFP